MSKTTKATKRATRKPTRESVEDRAARDRARVAFHVATMMVRAVRNHVAADCARALNVLDKLRPYLDGGERPAFLAEYSQLMELSGSVPSDSANDAQVEGATEQIEEQYGFALSSNDSAIELAYSVAAGHARSLDSMLSAARNSAVDAFSDGPPRAAIRDAISLALGGEVDEVKPAA